VTGAGRGEEPHGVRGLARNLVAFEAISRLVRLLPATGGIVVTVRRGRDRERGSYPGQGRARRHSTTAEFRPADSLLRGSRRLAMGVSEIRGKMRAALVANGLDGKNVAH
jgi:hypothetical protein